MGYSANKQSNQTTAYLNEYIADTESDLLKLPTNCAPGSTCIVIQTGNVYMLNNERKWVIFGGASSPSTGGGSAGGGGNEPQQWIPMV